MKQLNTNEAVLALARNLTRAMDESPSLIHPVPQRQDSPTGC